MTINMEFKIVHAGESGIVKTKKKVKVYNIFWRPKGSWLDRMFTSWTGISKPKDHDSHLFTEKEMVEFFTSQIVRNNRVTYIK